MNKYIEGSLRQIFYAMGVYLPDLAGYIITVNQFFNNFYAIIKRLGFIYIYGGYNIICLNLEVQNKNHCRELSNSHNESFLVGWDFLHFIVSRDH